MGSRRVFEFTAERAGEMERQRGKPSAERVVADARRLLAIAPALPALPYRALRGAGGGPEMGIRGQFAVETEPGVEAIVTAYGDFAAAMLPPTGAVTLYVGHISADDDVRRNPAVQRLARSPGFVTVDPRGIGQSQARTCGSRNFFESYGSDFLYASTGDMLNESYLGRRVFDVMRTIDFLLAYGGTEVRLVGRGLGAVSAAFAALLHPTHPQVHLINYLPSYALLTQKPQFSWPFSVLLRGCLEHFDLPDVYRVLGKRLQLSDPWNAAMKPARGSQLN
jgi:pimeloyl-ACP methyl ester carboxylesterase